MPLDSLRTDIARLSAFDWGGELKTIVESNVEEIANLQSNQLYAGIDSKGAEITLEGNGYSYVTMQIKKEKGQPIDRVTWNDTGDLHASLEAIVKGDTFTIDSKSEQEKFSSMIERSGEDVIGLNNYQKQVFADDVTLPSIKQSFKDKTGFEIS